MGEPERMIFINRSWQISIDAKYWDWLYQFGIRTYFDTIKNIGKSEASNYFNSICQINKLFRGFQFIVSKELPTN